MKEQINTLASGAVKIKDKGIKFILIGVLDLLEGMSSKMVALEEENKRLRESLAKTMAGGGRALGGNNGFSIG